MPQNGSNCSPPCGDLRHKFPILHAENLIGAGGQLRIVRDDQDGVAAVAGQSTQEIKNVVGVFDVEVAGGFIGEQQHGVVGEGAGDGDALLFTAGKLVGEAVALVAEADIREQLAGAFLHGIGVEPAEFAHGQQHVFQRGEFRQQEVKLKNKTQQAIARGGAGGVGSGGHEFAGNPDVTRVLLV